MRGRSSFSCQNEPVCWPMRILVVEDDEQVAELLVHTLMSEHHVVDRARDGAAGFELAVVNDYDVLVLDVMLPRMTGRELCRSFRREGFTTPILMLTAMGTSEDIIAGLDDGADDYLVKPFVVAELLARVRA